MATPIGPNMQNIESLRQQQAMQAVFHRGDAGRLGKAEEKTEPAENSPATDGLDVSNREQLSEGKLRTTYCDGRRVTTAPNGVIKEEMPCGTMKLSLPSGILIQRDPDGTTLAYDTNAGEFLKVDTHQNSPTSQYKFTLEDGAGNKYLATSNTLRFQVQNPSETLTEKVHASGSVNIQTKQLMRDPDSGRFHQDQVRVYVETDGDVHKYGRHASDLKVSGEDVQFTLHKDVHTDIDFPYQIPQLQGQPPSPNPPPQPPVPPSPPPPVIPTPVDPASSVITPSGLTRQTSADGTFLTALPNGIVVAQHPNGMVEAFDSSQPGAPLPVKASEVCHPGVGRETEYVFNDARGNRYQLYSKSLDFSATSPDGNLQQSILPQGNILMQSRTFSTNPKTGEQVPHYHQVEVYPNGWVNTFGEKGVYLTNNTVTFAGHGPAVTQALPYPVPPFQGMIGWLPQPSPPFASQPVSGHQPQVPGAPTPQPWIASTADSTKATDTGRATAEAAAQKRPAVNPGIWQRIKNFFSGDKTDKQSTCPGCKSIPNHHYIYGPDPAMQMFQTAMATTMAVNLFTMATMPMGFFYTPFIPILW